MKYIPIETRAHCFSGKQHRVSFNTNGPYKRPNFLDLVHSGVCMMDVKSLCGASCFATFIDDHSTKVRDFVLNSKYRVISVFKHFSASVGREKIRKLKCVRVNNCGEYRCPFEEYCKENGIRLEKIFPNTPQHSEVVENINHTINDKIICILSHAKLPKSFWGNTLIIAVDLINISPFVPVDDVKMSLIYLRVFG